MSSPLFDPELADQIFVAHDSDDIANLRAMVAEFETDTAPRFGRLAQVSAAGGSDPTEAKRALHGLRGVVANFSLTRAAEQLRDLEMNWANLAAPLRNARLQEAEANLRSGLSALREHYPHLKG